MDLTPAFSDSGSNSVAADDSHFFPASELQISKQAQSKNWTDDMHRSYLDSLEASFVKELHNSLQLQARNVGNKVTIMQTDSPNSLDKCMVLRDGCWQKIEFKMSEYLMDSTADYPFYRRGNIKRLIEYDFNCGDSVVSKSEVSDQNFVDDVPVRASVNTTGSK